jgi:hypothetical protein
MLQFKIGDIVIYNNKVYGHSASLIGAKCIVISVKTEPIYKGQQLLEVKFLKDHNGKTKDFTDIYCSDRFVLRMPKIKHAPRWL